MNALVSAANIGSISNTREVFEKMCRDNFVDEFWINVENPFNNPKSARGYFTTLQEPKDNKVDAHFEQLLCPAAYSDDEDIVMSTDFIISEVKEQNGVEQLRDLNSVKNDPTFRLLYKDGRGVLFG